MKSLKSTAFCLALLLFLTGCGSAAPGGKSVSQTVTVKDVLDAGIAAAEVTPSPPPVRTPEPSVLDKPKESTEAVDIDLTVLSGTMVYSEVYNMITSPEEYIGKTVKMDGAFAYYHDDTTGSDYFACIIQDATACCVQGIEFVLEGEHVYPEDYPELGAEICVTGVFDTYSEDDYVYCTLRSALLL